MPGRWSCRSRSCGRGPNFPDWLLVPRRRAEQALVSVVADMYLAGVSTRRVDKLVQQLGLEGMPRSQQRAAATLVRSIFDQPDAASVRDQHPAS